MIPINFTVYKRMVCMRRMAEVRIVPYYEVFPHSNVFQIWANGSKQGESILVELPNRLWQPMVCWKPGPPDEKLESWQGNKSQIGDLHAITNPIQIAGFQNGWIANAEIFTDPQARRTWWGFWAYGKNRSVTSTSVTWVATEAPIPHRKQISGAGYRPPRRQ